MLLQTYQIVESVLAFAGLSVKANLFKTLFYLSRFLEFPHYFLSRFLAAKVDVVPARHLFYLAQESMLVLMFFYV